MKRALVSLSGIAALTLLALVAVRAEDKFVPVTQKMLENPSPDDWLMYSRTFDAQRFSPLQQITRTNVATLKEAFKVELGNGPHESIPIAYRGVLYVQSPGASIQALNGATGETIWEYKYASGGSSRAKTLSIFEDMVYYPAPDGFIVALDARTGELLWNTNLGGTIASGPITYSVDGQQYVAVAGEGALYVFGLPVK